MGRAIVRQYEKGDAAKLEWRAGDMLGDKMEDYELPAWTMTVDDKPAACVGLSYEAEGIYTLWGAVSDAARGHGITMVKFMNEVLDSAYDKLGIHRISTTVRDDIPEYIKWIELLGFTYEGTMRQATPNKTDMRMYARLRT